jgi:RNA polymerase sigma-70 factor (ECF subfamily)
MPVDDANTRLDRARAGDRAAFEALLAAEGPAVGLVADLLIGAPGAADSAVEQAWSEAVRRLDELGDAHALRVCLLGTVVDRRDDHVRGHDPRPVAGPFIDLDDEHPHEEHRWKGAWADTVRSWRPDDEARLSPDVEAVVVDTLTRVPSLPRSVGALRDVAGLPPPDVAELLGIEPDDVAPLLQWTREAVRSDLDRHFGIGHFR